MIEGLILPDVDHPEAAAFWEGCAAGELRVQTCTSCGRRRMPPRPMCPWCRSFDVHWTAMSGRARIWSVVIPHPPLLPAYGDQAPYNVVVVELEDDPSIRFVGNVVADADAPLNSIDPHTLEIGSAVEVVFSHVADDVWLPHWVTASDAAEAPDMRGLEGKVVVVAGGAGGIGTATSMRLAEEGAKVVVGDLNEGAAKEVADGISSFGGTAIAVQFDVSDDESVGALVRAAVDAFGRIDRCHANAADLSVPVIMGDTDALDIDLDIWDRTMQVNLRGFLLCTRHVIPELVKSAGGAIVYTSSAASFVGEPARPAYAAAKSGVNTLMRHVASKWGKQRIRANAIAPGLVVSDQMSEVIPQDLQDRTLKGTRSWRLGHPRDIAAMVAFLLSDDGEWINGQVISVDGGVTLR